MAKLAYARCSTKDDRQDIERQTRELTARGASRIFSEYISGTAALKPEQARLFASLDTGDTLTVTEVSRLSRNLHQLCHVLEDAESKKIKLECGALVLNFAADPDPMSRAMFYMMGVFAELERGVTVERIKSGLSNAKAKGAAMGRPRKTADDVPQAVKDKLPAYKAGEISAAELARQTGYSRQVIYKYLRLLDITPKDSRRMTAAAIPKKIRDLYPAYAAGTLGVSEYARLAEVSRDTIYRHIALMESQG